MTTRTTPVTVTTAAIGLVTAVLALLTAFGVDLTQAQQGAILGFVAAVLVVASLLWQRWGIDRAKVVEQTDDGRVVTAGPANELPTGVVVREDLGDLPRRALPETDE
ncbi:Uncharacterised protein [Mycobacteroides abscessus subsp. abscessus]|nr:Uncharacterised protein [Mycobacteroides abscessus subsp. abscessus]